MSSSQCPGGRRRSSNPLHNFNLPLNNLRWGNQRLLRCTKISRSETNLSQPTTSTESPVRKHTPGPAAEDSVEIEDVREKLMRDLRMAAKKMMIRRSSVALEEEEGREVSPSPDEEAAAVEAGRPWNLRTRRAACRAPSGEGGGGSGVYYERTTRGSPPARNGERREREKFSVGLSREEVELDYLVMVGTRPPRRPKKRPRIIQRQLEFVFPGSWLTEITLDRYRVPETVDLPKS